VAELPVDLDPRTAFLSYVIMLRAGHLTEDTSGRQGSRGRTMREDEKWQSAWWSRAEIK
jgi:hypothetical protein